MCDVPFDWVSTATVVADYDIRSKIQRERKVACLLVEMARIGS